MGNPRRRNLSEPVTRSAGLSTTTCSISASSSAAMSSPSSRPEMRLLEKGGSLSSASRNPMPVASKVSSSSSSSVRTSNFSSSITASSFPVVGASCPRHTPAAPQGRNRKKNRSEVGRRDITIEKGFRGYWPWEVWSKEQDNDDLCIFKVGGDYNYSINEAKSRRSRRIGVQCRS